MSPTSTQWLRIMDGPTEEPITLINLFKLRGPRGDHNELSASGSGASGSEEMLRYAAISGPALERVGGQFLLMAAFETSLMGEDEEWDLVAIGKYPSRDALFRLFDDADSASAFAHRRAALEKQRVWVVKG